MPRLQKGRKKRKRKTKKFLWILQKKLKISKKNMQRTKIIKIQNSISTIQISEKKLYFIAAIVPNLLAQNASQNKIENITV